MPWRIPQTSTLSAGGGDGAYNTCQTSNKYIYVEAVILKIFWSQDSAWATFALLPT